MNEEPSVVASAEPNVPTACGFETVFVTRACESFTAGADEPPQAERARTIPIELTAANAFFLPDISISSVHSVSDVQL